MSDVKKLHDQAEKASAVELSGEEQRFLEQTRLDAKPARPENRLKKWLKNPPLFLFWWCW